MKTGALLELHYRFFMNCTFKTLHIYEKSSFFVGIRFVRVITGFQGRLIAFDKIGPKATFPEKPRVFVLVLG